MHVSFKFPLFWEEKILVFDLNRVRLRLEFSGKM